jgi:hypothetical protein
MRETELETVTLTGGEDAPIHDQEPFDTRSRRSGDQRRPE